MTICGPLPPLAGYACSLSARPSRDPPAHFRRLPFAFPSVTRTESPALVREPVLRRPVSSDNFPYR